MKLTQALCKSSLIIDGANNNEVASNPELHGGFEFGTWGDANLIFDAIIEENRYNVRLISECSFGVQISHRFTQDECDTILTHLKTFEDTEIEDEGKLIEVKQFSSCSLNCLYIEGYNKLVKLFSDKEDLPVYYWSN